VTSTSKAVFQFANLLSEWPHDSDSSCYGVVFRKTFKRRKDEFVTLQKSETYDSYGPSNIVTLVALGKSLVSTVINFWIP
jgi:hypothetical protein